MSLTEPAGCSSACGGQFGGIGNTVYKKFFNAKLLHKMNWENGFPSSSLEELLLSYKFKNL